MSCIRAHARTLYVQPSQQPESTQSVARSKTQSYLCHKAHAPSCAPVVEKTHSRFPYCSLSSFLPANVSCKIILQQQAARGTHMHDCDCAFLAKVPKHLRDPHWSISPIWLLQPAPHGSLSPEASSLPKFQNSRTSCSAFFNLHVLVQLPGLFRFEHHDIFALLVPMDFGFPRLMSLPFDVTVFHNLIMTALHDAVGSCSFRNKQL